MVFDEAIEEVKEHDFTYDETSGTMKTFSVIGILDELKEEYAPTVEMTKEQYEAFVESVEGLATQKQLDSFVDEELDLGDMTVRRGLNAWLHPETIKIIGDENE